MSGYWDAPRATAEVLDDDGWYRTGDVARRGPDGLLTVVGRTREVIVSGGFNVYPGEVERVVRALPGVRDVAVVGVPHERWGEGVAAVVVPEPGATVTSEDVVAGCRRELAGFKKPVRVEVVDSLPRTGTGKIDRRRVETSLLNG